MAGAYLLQEEGRKLIEALEGDYLSAVGLPLRAVDRLLRKAGIRTEGNVEAIYRRREVMNWKSYEE